MLLGKLKLFGSCNKFGYLNIFNIALLFNKIVDFHSQFRVLPLDGHHGSAELQILLNSFQLEFSCLLKPPQFSLLKLEINLRKLTTMRLLTYSISDLGTRMASEKSVKRSPVRGISTKPRLITNCICLLWIRWRRLARVWSSFVFRMAIFSFWVATRFWKVAIVASPSRIWIWAARSYNSNFCLESYTFLRLTRMSYSMRNLRCLQIRCQTASSMVGGNPANKSRVSRAFM